MASFSSQTSDIDIVVPSRVSRRSLSTVLFFFHLALTPTRYSFNSVNSFKLVDRRESRTLSIGQRMPKIGGRNILASQQRYSPDDFSQRERERREINITRVNLFWRDQFALLLDRARVPPPPSFPVPLFLSPFLSEMVSLSFVYTGFSSRFLSCFPTLRYIATYAGLFLANRLAPKRSTHIQVLRGLGCFRLRAYGAFPRQCCPRQHARDAITFTYIQTTERTAKKGRERVGELRGGGRERKRTRFRRKKNAARVRARVE